MAISPSFSFTGWDILEFLKGRKKLVVGLIGGLVGLAIKDSASAAIISASIFEGVFAVAEYYIKFRRA